MANFGFLRGPKENFKIFFWLGICGRAGLVVGFFCGRLKLNFKILVFWNIKMCAARNFNGGACGLRGFNKIKILKFHFN